jgi:hypothetical protein
LTLMRSNMSSPDKISTGDRMRALRPMLLDVLLPMGAYYLLRHRGFDPTEAYAGAILIAAGWMVINALRSRKFDVIAAFVLVTLAVQLVVSLIAQDLRLALATDSVISGVAGLAMLLSCVARRPAIHLIAQQVVGSSGPRREQLDHRWATLPGYRKMIRIMTLVFGVTLLAEALLRVGLLLVLGPDAVIGISRLLQLVTIAGLVLWAVYYGKRKLSTTRPTGDHAISHEPRPR